MKLYQLIELLWNRLPDSSSYSVIAMILSNRGDGNAFEQWPVTDIRVDADAETIDLVVSAGIGRKKLIVTVGEDGKKLLVGASADQKKSHPIALEVIELLVLLDRLMPTCQDHDMYLSAVPIDVPDGWSATQDLRVMGVAWSSERKNLDLAGFRSIRLENE